MRNEGFAGRHPGGIRGACPPGLGWLLEVLEDHSRRTAEALESSRRLAHAGAEAHLRAAEALGTAAKAFERLATSVASLSERLEALEAAVRERPAEARWPRGVLDGGRDH